MDKNKILDGIFKNDPLGLLTFKPKNSAVRTASERLLASFQEINVFIEKYGKEPKPNANNISEFQLYSRLKNLREDEEKIEMLKSEDINNILPAIETCEVNEHQASYQKPKEIDNIVDIFGDDSLNILGDDSEGLFDFKHTPKETTMPDYVAKRKKCKEFKAFEQLFIMCQRDLSSRKRELLKFKKEQQIEKGYFFVLKGVLLYVDEVGKREPDKNGKLNARLRCIFENGTESDMLLRSLAAELYKNGRRVTEHEDNLLNGLLNITDEDEKTGYIYVLKSLSNDENISTIKNLYKIGYSTVDVKDRIKNAHQEPTYLMASVSIQGVWKCFNMNPHKLELLLHKFFGNSCLELDVFDKKGKRHTPREWFIAPIEVIDQAIELVINRKIVKYKFDSKKMIIENRV
jgi:hypothetical protein